MTKWLYTIASSLLMLGVTAPIAAASDYSNDTNSTQLVIREDRADGQGGGFYFTQFKGDRWMGDIAITQVQGNADRRVYSGTFVDRPPVRRQQPECNGDIRLVRSAGDAVSPVSMRVTWTVKGGTNCPSVGQVFELQLTESLPKADSDGNYTPANSNTAIGELIGPYTWPMWSVIAADGKLNCRATPEVMGKVVFTLKAGDRFDTRNRSANSLETAADGTTWLKVPTKRCFVRATDRTVKPVSIPF